MSLVKSLILTAVLACGVLLGGCQFFGGAKNQSTTPISITRDQIIGFWQSQVQSVGKTDYYYLFSLDGTLAVSEDTADNLVLNGTFAIEQGKSLNIQLTNPRDGAVILAMTWLLINASANELVFKLAPDDGVILLRRVN